jgi:hypothetical protein
MRCWRFPDDLFARMLMPDSGTVEHRSSEAAAPLLDLGLETHRELVCAPGGSVKVDAHVVVSPQVRRHSRPARRARHRGSLTKRSATLGCHLVAVR